MELDFRDSFKKYDVMTEIKIDPILLKDPSKLKLELQSKIRNDVLETIHKRSKDKAW